MEPQRPNGSINVKLILYNNEWSNKLSNISHTIYNIYIYYAFILDIEYHACIFKFSSYNYFIRFEYNITTRYT